MDTEETFPLRDLVEKKTRGKGRNGPGVQISWTGGVNLGRVSLKEKK